MSGSFTTFTWNRFLGTREVKGSSLKGRLSRLYGSISCIRVSTKYRDQMGRYQSTGNVVRQCGFFYVIGSLPELAPTEMDKEAFSQELA